MSGGYFREVRAGDIAHIAANLRQADQDEITASRGPADPADVLAEAVLLSSHCWVGVADDEEPVALFGVVPVSILSGKGSPWFLSTERAYDYPRTLISESRRYLSKMRAEYPHLFNYVDARNDRSIRWLKRMGFTVHETAPYGVAGLPFHKFEMKGPD